MLQSALLHWCQITGDWQLTAETKKLSRAEREQKVTARCIVAAGPGAISLKMNKKCSVFCCRFAVNAALPEKHSIFFLSLKDWYQSRKEI